MTDNERRYLVLVEASLRELLSLMEHGDACDTCVVSFDHGNDGRARTAIRRAKAILKG